MQVYLKERIMQGSREIDKIMQEIKPHLLPGTSHYNRVYEAVQRFDNLKKKKINIGSVLCKKIMCGDRGDWFCDPSCERFESK